MCEGGGVQCVRVEGVIHKYKVQSRTAAWKRVESVMWARKLKIELK